MGLFDKIKKNNDKNDGADEEVVMDGWGAIDEAFLRVYPGQEERKHFGTLIPWRLGGPDPLDGISVYDGGDCWHFVTYGLSELYEKESDDPKWSGFGMEFTMRLKKNCCEDEEAEIRCVCGNFQNLIYTGQKNGIDVRQMSALTGFITVPDTLVRGIDTPNGHVDFVEFIGATDAELLKIQSKETTVRELFEKIGDMTDYSRKSLF